MRLRGLNTLVAAYQFLREHYLAEFNAQFAHAAEQSRTAFTACHRIDLEFVFALQHERTVARDNTVSYGNRVLQIEKSKWRFSLSGCEVKMYEHSDGSLSIGYGPHIVGRYDHTGSPLASTPPPRQRQRSVAKSKLPGAKNQPAVEMTPFPQLLLLDI